ncbi:energy transducer TonB [Flaviaesturariibacter amylovorans]|uniref:TonB C-terminal domain-containing protein n=1 Tax=Flaviaesturariibacter amylovorans TaxID=1084520 RepID=A0ABP8H9V8_9BACT
MKTFTLFAALLLVFNLSAIARNTEDKPATTATSELVAPAFRGGNKAHNAFRMDILNKMIRTAMLQQLPAGSYNVVLSFDVDARGNVSNVQAVSKNGFGLEAKAVELFRKSARWTPAQKAGQNIKARHTENFRFEVM